MQNKVSVIVPVFNAASTILICMESIRTQTYTNLEVIIIDDGSSDDSACLIEQYILEKQVMDWLFITRKNKGVSTTRNEGIQKCTGDYIAFLDADDQWLPEKIELQMDFLKRMKAGIVGCCFEKRANKDHQVYTLKEMLFHNRVNTSTVVVRQDIIQAHHGFDENMKYSEDYNLWLKIAIDEKIYVLSDALVIYDFNQQGGGLTKKLWLMEKGELYNYKYLFINKHINRSLYLKATMFSLFKYVIRRIRKVLHL